MSTRSSRRKRSGISTPHNDEPLSSYNIDDVFKTLNKDTPNEYYNYVEIYKRLLKRMEKRHTKDEKIKGAMDIYELTERIPDDFFIDHPYFTHTVFLKASYLERDILRFKKNGEVDAALATSAITLIKRVRLKKLTPILKMPTVKAALKLKLKAMREARRKQEQAKTRKIKKMSSTSTFSSGIKSQVYSTSSPK